MFKRIACVLALCALSTPALAEEDNGTSLMERGVELFFEGLREEMSPAVENLRLFAEEFGPELSSFLKEMGPGIAKMLDEVKDWTQYSPPEILPNGDIIIRKKTKPEEPSKPKDEAPAKEPPSGTIDL